MVVTYLAKSHNVCVITGESVSADASRGYRLLCVRTRFRIPHLTFAIMATRALVLELTKEKFDVVHIIGNYFSAPLALAARMAHVPLIVQTIAGMEAVRIRHPVMGIPIWGSLRVVHAITAPNRYQSELLSKITGKPVTYIPNGIETIPMVLSSNNSTFTFCTISRLSKGKRIDLLINAAEILRKDNCDFRLLIIGDGEERKRLQQMIRARGLEGIVVLLGYLPHPVALGILASADCYVSASKSEGYGLSIAEAVSYGKPIIASYFKGIEELVRDKENGLIARHPHDLHTLMRSLIDNRDLLHQLSIGSLRMSRNLRNWKEVSCLYEQFYSTFLRR
jgi:glycosyltransferase involved in cell wall biosynthesis